jgi:prepilin-type processing-associated H-X9-DG protein
MRTPAVKIMFTDAGDWTAYMSGADYKTYWDQHGQDIVAYRNMGMWRPVYFRHSEGANIAYFDGHVEYRKKEQFFYYQPPESTSPDLHRNGAIWFCDLSKRNAEMGG